MYLFLSLLEVLLLQFFSIPCIVAVSSEFFMSVLASVFYVRMFGDLQLHIYSYMLVIKKPLRACVCACACVGGMWHVG